MARLGIVLALSGAMLALLCPSFCAIAAIAPDISHFQYVIDAANEITSISEGSVDNIDSTLKMADVSCSMLTKLLDDKMFSKIVYTGISGQPKEDIQHVLSSVEKLNHFVEQEQILLKETNFQPLSALNALSAALSISKKIDPRKISVQSVLSDVTVLRDRVCSLRKEAEKTKDWGKTRSLILLGTYGAGIVVADGAAAYFSLGLLSLVTGTSITIGAGLVSSAAYGYATK